MTTYVFLLNPKKAGNWVNSRDYVILDPFQNKSSNISKLDSLINSKQNWASTPLHRITNFIRSELNRYTRSREVQGLDNIICCYNIVTDGEPDNRDAFVTELKEMAKTVFFVVNLCTDNERIVNFYNDLDQSVGSELSGMDVIDDMIGEAEEVQAVGNLFFTYDWNIHRCRMAGCHSRVADLMDEDKLPLAGALHLTSQLLKLDENKELADEKDPIAVQEYLEYISSVTDEKQVYDVKSKTFKPLININMLENVIHGRSTSSYGGKNVVFNVNTIICIIVAIFAIMWLNSNGSGQSIQQRKY